MWLRIYTKFWRVSWQPFVYYGLKLHYMLYCLITRLIAGNTVRKHLRKKEKFLFSSMAWSRARLIGTLFTMYVKVSMTSRQPSIKDGKFYIRYKPADRLYVCNNSRSSWKIATLSTWQQSDHTKNIYSDRIRRNNYKAYIMLSHTIWTLSFSSSLYHSNKYK